MRYIMYLGLNLLKQPPIQEKLNTIDVLAYLLKHKPSFEDMHTTVKFSEIEISQEVSNEQWDESIKGLVQKSKRVTQILLDRMDSYIQFFASHQVRLTKEISTLNEVAFKATEMNMIGMHGVTTMYEGVNALNSEINIILTALYKDEYLTPGVVEKLSPILRKLGYTLYPKQLYYEKAEIPDLVPSSKPISSHGWNFTNLTKMASLMTAELKSAKKMLPEHMSHLEKVFNKYAAMTGKEFNQVIAKQSFGFVERLIYLYRLHITMLVTIVSGLCGKVKKLPVQQ